MPVNEIPVQQAAAAKVTRPLPSLAERGVATQYYDVSTTMKYDGCLSKILFGCDAQTP